MQMRVEAVLFLASRTRMVCAKREGVVQEGPFAVPYTILGGKRAEADAACEGGPCAARVPKGKRDNV